MATSADQARREEHLIRTAAGVTLRFDARLYKRLLFIITDFKRHRAAVLLVEVRPNVRYKLERGGLIAHVGEDNVIDTLEQALLRAKELQSAVQP